ncbi:MAG: type II toxin-antitoxin system Phd/YefM family antitoxin [Egibacteraceae bacterium]
MLTAGVTEAKAQLSKLLEAVQRGERVVISRAGKPVAELTIYRGDVRPCQLGGWAGRVWIADDFDGLPEDVLVDFES